jgi:hypothetical protein
MLFGQSGLIELTRATTHCVLGMLFGNILSEAVSCEVKDQEHPAAFTHRQGHAVLRTPAGRAHGIPS